MNTPFFTAHPENEYLKHHRWLKSPETDSHCTCSPEGTLSGTRLF